MYQRCNNSNCERCGGIDQGSYDTLRNYRSVHSGFYDESDQNVGQDWQGQYYPEAAQWVGTSARRIRRPTNGTVTRRRRTAHPTVCPYCQNRIDHDGPHGRPTYGNRLPSEAVSDTRNVVQEMLRRHKLLMMSYTYCPYCKTLAKKLDDENISYYKWEVDVLPNKNQIVKEFEKLSGIRTAPQMFVNGRFVGDGTKTGKMIDSGEFHKLIGRRNDTKIMNAVDLVQGMLERHPVIMMSFAYCPCCNDLAVKLKNAGISYYKFDVDKLPNRTEVINEFEKLSGIRTAPQMFVLGEFVGDGSTTGEMIASGELQQLITHYGCQ